MKIETIKRKLDNIWEEDVLILFVAWLINIVVLSAVGGSSYWIWEIVVLQTNSIGYITFPIIFILMLLPLLPFTIFIFFSTLKEIIVDFIQG